MNPRGDLPLHNLARAVKYVYGVVFLVGLVYEEYRAVQEVILSFLDVVVKTAFAFYVMHDASSSVE